MNLWIARIILVVLAVARPIRMGRVSVRPVGALGDADFDRLGGGGARGLVRPAPERPGSFLRKFRQSPKNRAVSWAKSRKQRIRWTVRRCGSTW